MNPKTEIITAFNRHAPHYEQAAKVQNEIGLRLFERLDYLKAQPRCILDLGCGPGAFTLMLKKKYPDALIVGLDLAQSMLLQSQKKQRFWKKWSLVTGDMMTLPFADHVFDLVFANQVIHWSEPMSQVIKEINRVMHAQGCLMFSTLGPDTFKEMKASWTHADNYAHTNIFKDMHDTGDMLVQERFLDPVMDMEFLTVHYASLSQLVNGLKRQGVRNINPDRNKGLTGKRSWQAFEENYRGYCTVEGKYPLTYEVIYGHAWKGTQQRTDKGVETFISVSSIKTLRSEYGV